MLKPLPPFQYQVLKVRYDQLHMRHPQSGRQLHYLVDDKSLDKKLGLYNGVMAYALHHSPCYHLIKPTIDRAIRCGHEAFLQLPPLPQTIIVAVDMSTIPLFLFDEIYPNQPPNVWIPRHFDSILSLIYGLCHMPHVNRLHLCSELLNQMRIGMEVKDQKDEAKKRTRHL